MIFLLKLLFRVGYKKSFAEVMGECALCMATGCLIVLTLTPYCTSRQLSITKTWCKCFNCQSVVLNCIGIIGVHDECLVAVAVRFPSSQSLTACHVATG